MPTRIQRKRTKGWRMPPNTVYVGRPTCWGNPEKYCSKKPSYLIRKNMVKEYKKSLLNGAICSWKAIIELKGKNLACWCPLDKPCHADILLQIANS